MVLQWCLKLTAYDVRRVDGCRDCDVCPALHSALHHGWIQIWKRIEELLNGGAFDALKHLVDVLRVHVDVFDGAVFGDAVHHLAILGGHALAQLAVGASGGHRLEHAAARLRALDLSGAVDRCPATCACDLQRACHELRKTFDQNLCPVDILPDRQSAERFATGPHRRLCQHLQHEVACRVVDQRL